MKTILSITACALTMGMLAQTTTEKREIGAFSRIDASGAAIIVYENAAAPSLQIEGDATELKNIETMIKSNTLVIKTKGDFHHPFKIRVGGASLDGLTLSGASHFEATGPVKADVFTLKASGASHVEMPLSAKTVKTEIDGASSILLKGETQDFLANISGASDLKASDLRSANATVKASGASMARVYASQKLSTESTGASSIKYKGEPKDIYKKSTDASQVDRIN